VNAAKFALIAIFVGLLALAFARGLQQPEHRL
jgi:hypothetical protein